MIMRLTILLVLFVLLVNAWLHRPLLDSFLFAVALAVGLTPELLPMVVSVTLSRGAMRMAKKRVIVKRLPAIQNLGSMDVLCTDKTGTLTEARISLAGCFDADGVDSPRALMLAHLNSAFESGLKSPLDDAILAHDADVKAWRKIDEVPFDFERRRVSVLVERGDDRWLVVKGAPDDVLAQCSSREGGDGHDATPLDAAAIDALHARCRAFEREGLRVLAVAWRAVPHDHGHADVRDERELVFAGFATFIDPPKPGAAEALAALARSGVQVKIVSGDSELVTQHLCGLLGIQVEGVLTGREIAQMDEAALRARVSRTTLFCRVNPAQKNRIVLAFKARGHVVGYLGDGINDAPPLRSADVGITVDSAADVAREVADMVMLDHDLAVLHDGVVEGRRTFGNVMKYIMMGTSSNFGNMLSMAVASMFLPFLPMLPTQILLNNFLYDLAQVTIPTDRVDPSFIRKPQRWRIDLIRDFMIWIGPVSSVFDFVTFWVLLKMFRASAALFHTGWFVESLATQALVLFVIRTAGNPFRSRPSAPLAITTVLVVVIAGVLPFTPAAAALGFVPLPGRFFVFLLAIAGSYLVCVEAVKRRLLRRHAA
jgi:Mg2+-importing ATPase